MRDWEDDTIKRSGLYGYGCGLHKLDPERCPYPDKARQHAYYCAYANGLLRAKKLEAKPPKKVRWVKKVKRKGR